MTIKKKLIASWQKIFEQRMKKITKTYKDKKFK